MARTKIHYVLVIDMDEITDERKRKNYYKMLIEHNKQEKEFTYEKYEKFIKDWKEDKYSFSSFQSSFHTSRKEAIEYVTKNIADINEAGCYNYAAVVSAPIGLAYYNTGVNPEKDIKLFKYNRETDSYVPMDKKEDGFRQLRDHAWGMISLGNNDDE